jgi:hypothetical protein
VAAPSAPSPRPTRPALAYGRHGTRARAWRCWGLAQAAYKWLKAVGLGAGACCVHCVAPAPSATQRPPSPNPPPKHSRPPPSQYTWTPSLLVARGFRANFDTESTPGLTTCATRAGGSEGVNTAYPMSQLLSWDFACTETMYVAAYSAYSLFGKKRK